MGGERGGGCVWSGGEGGGLASTLVHCPARPSRPSVCHMLCGVECGLLPSLWRILCSVSSQGGVIGKDGRASSKSVSSLQHVLCSGVFAARQ